MNVGKLTNFLRHLGDSLAANDALHAAEGCWIAAALVARYGKLKEENRELRAALRKIDEILTRPAGNMRLMQIAEPARRCRKIVKKAMKGGVK